MNRSGPHPSPVRKWGQVYALAAVELLAMGMWFSASAVVPQLTEEWGLTASQRSWMTMSVQCGFVVGAMISAVLNLADRVPPPRLIAACAFAGGLLNGAVPLLNPGAEATLALRFLTGVALAGVYPPGMKVVASWCKRDRGLGIGLLVGALTLGTAVPHLLNAVPLFGPSGMPPWRGVLSATSALALVAAALALLVVRTGPHLAESAPFDWRFVARALAHRPTRLANLGYLGHMWELYAMWAWVPILLIESYQAAAWSTGAARLAAFAVIGVGAVGCVLAGILADRFGRTTVAVWSLAVSGGSALSAGLFFDRPGVLTAVCLVWGFAVVADSAQFSAAVSELTDPRYVGTALTVQTCLGFTLTLLTIRLIPPLTTRLGWHGALALLALGPAFGIWSMLSLRRDPASTQMASGNR